MKNRRERTTASNRGFTLLEVMAAIGVLVLGLVSVLAVFVDRVPLINKSQEKKTAALAMRSVASALELAFATPINPEATQTTGTWDPEGGPKIRFDHRGAYDTDPEDPEGFAIITLPGTPLPSTKPDELIPVRWPRNVDAVYSLARPLRLTGTTGGGTGGTATGPSEDEPIDLMGAYSYSITFKNWRRIVRTKVPSLSDSGTTKHPDTESARIRQYDPLNANDGTQTGRNLGYLVTVRIFRNYSALTTTERQLEKRNPTIVLEQTFIFSVTAGFGVTR